MNTILRNLQPYRDWQNGIIGSAVALPILFSAGLCANQKLGISIHQVSTLKQVKFLWKTADFDKYLNFISVNPADSVMFFALPIASIACWAWLSTHLLREIDPILHLRGRRFLIGKKAIKAAKNASKKLLGAPNFNIELTKNIFLTLAKELQSILIMGCQGAGKTVILNGIMQKIIAKDEKALVFDLTKGDYTAWVDVPIISPTDARSLYWAISRDLTNVADASTFANSMIPTNEKDPFWSNTSQNVLIAIIVKLQHELGQNWGFAELSDLIFSTEIDKLKQLCETYYPPANGSLVDAESKMTGSVIVNLRSFCAPIYRLNQSWQNVDRSKLICFSTWLQNDSSVMRQIIIQGDQRDSVLSAALARAITNFCTNRISSLQFAESKTRKIWFVLDELPQIGRLEQIAKLLEIGRSKGVAVIFGFQDIAQIRQIYPKNEEQKWLSMFGLKIFPKVQGSESQKWVCQEIGEREVQYLSKSVSSNLSGKSVSSNYQKEIIPVLLPSQLDSEFGPSKNGINALVIGLGGDALRLNFAYPEIQNVRKPFVTWPQTSLPSKSTKSQFEVEQEIELAKTEAEIEEIKSKILNAVDLLLPALEPIKGVQKSENETEHKIENEVIEKIAEPILNEILGDIVGLDSHVLEAVSAVFEAGEAIKSDPKSENQPAQNQNMSAKKKSKKERLAEYESD